MTAEEARFAAARQFGNATRMRERSYEVMGFRMETVAQDLRFAMRQMGRDPGFAVTAMLMLALGIGASVAIFAFVDAALIRPLPYAQPNRLMDVTESMALFPRGNLSYQDFQDWQRMNTSFASLDAYTGKSDLFRGPNGTETVNGMAVSAGFFRTLGVRPLLGRDFHPGEDAVSAPATMLLTYKGWQKRFGGRADVVGQSVQLSEAPVRIIGVLPASFAFAPGGDPEYVEALQPRGGCDARRSCHSLFAVGRLKDGVRVAAALANMKAIAAAAGEAVSGFESGAERERDAAGEGDYGRRSSDFAGAAGGVGLAAGDCVRECSQSTAGAVGKPRAGDGAARCAGRVARAIDSPIRYGGSAAGGCGERRGIGGRLWDDTHTSAIDSYHHDGTIAVSR